MTRALGVDISSTSVRIAELEVSSHIRIVLGLHEIPLSPGDSFETACLKLRAYLTEHGIHYERLATSTSNLTVLFKRFDLPFGDKKRVVSSIRGEFEDTLPFELDNYSLEIRPLLRKPRIYSFLAGLAPSDDLLNLNQGLESAGLSPNSLHWAPESIAQLALAQNLPASEHDNEYAVCYLGSESTSIAILQGSNPRIFDSKAANRAPGEILQLRQIPKGSRDLVKWLSQKQNLSEGEVLDWIHHRAEIKISSEGAETIADSMSDEIKTGLRPVIVEIYQTLQSHRGKTGRLPSTLYLSGPLTGLTGLAEFIASELRVAVHHWPVGLGFTTQTLQLSADQERDFAVAISLAHSFGLKKATGWLNFRRSTKGRERILTTGFESFLQRDLFAFWKLYGVSLGASIALTLLFTVAASFDRSNLQSAIGAEFKRINASLIGKKAPAFLESPKLSRDVYDREKKKKLAATKHDETPHSYSRIDVLLDLSESFPQGYVVRELSIDDMNTKLGIRTIFESDKALSAPEIDTMQKTLASQLGEKGYSEFKITSLKSGKEYQLSARWKGIAQ